METAATYQKQGNATDSGPECPRKWKHGPRPRDNSVHRLQYVTSWLTGTSHALVAVFLCFFLLLSPAFALDVVPMATISFLDLKEDATRASATGRTLMLLFEQEGCGYCVEMHRVNFADREIVSLIESRFDLLQLDIRGDRELTGFDGVAVAEKQYARNLNTQLTPTTVFLDTDGRELLRMSGYYKPPMFKAALRYVADRRYQQESFRDYVRRTVSETASGKLKEEPFFRPADDLAAAMNAAARNGKGLVLLFEQRYCLGCDELHDRTFRNPDAVGKLTGAYDVVRIDLWGKRPIKRFDGSATTEIGLGAAMDIHYTPTMVFFDRNGAEIFRFDSYRKPEHFLVLLRYLTTDAHVRFKSFSDWMSAERSAHP
jgi:thioredoxin-related protein